MPTFTGAVQKSVLDGTEILGIDDTAASGISKGTNINSIIAAVRKSILEDFLPIGTQAPYYSGSLPSSHWLLCNGQAVSRTTYADLFAVIGTVFGVGDGSTTFNLPDMRGEFIRGYDPTGNIDPDGGSRTLGDKQGSAIWGHGHNALLRADSTTTAGGAYPAAYQEPSGTEELRPYVENIIELNHGLPTVSTESRPRNISMAYYIIATH